MTKRIISSTATPSLRWIGRGDDRVLQQSFAVVTVDEASGHMAGHYEWLEVPTFMEMTYEDAPPLSSIKIEFKRDWKHFEDLIKQVIAKLDDASPQADACPCGDNDGNWCSLSGCPFPRQGTATSSKGGQDNASDHR
ncbi:MAG TPA: hypothetical protein VGN93_31180 [Shinella sp.]|uniref:hypothetical protein n=1 Tax=Shinella sp. TaxID=1870904 RepID=UPI002E13CFF0|nr:hypothetical protein [Shinella sp.]